jgi:hypothetical protein
MMHNVPSFSTARRFFGTYIISLDLLVTCIDIYAKHPYQSIGGANATQGPELVATGVELLCHLLDNK